jgi:hypothetical protein
MGALELDDNPLYDDLLDEEEDGLSNDTMEDDDDRDETEGSDTNTWSVDSMQQQDWARAGDREGEGAEFQFLAGLTSLVVSAVRTAFLPDNRLEVVSSPDHLIVPIIVLRNHDLFDPTWHPLRSKARRESDTRRSWHSHEEYFIDVEKIRAEVSRLLLPHQELTIVTGTHSLYANEKMAVALASSLRTRIEHTQWRKETVSTASEAAGRLRFLSTPRMFVDSKELQFHLWESGDLLTDHLLEMTATSSTGGVKIGSHGTPNGPAVASDASINELIHEGIAGIQDGTYGKGTGTKGAFVSSSLGMQMLPVFVFSIAGSATVFEDETLFDEGRFEAYSSQGVVALQRDTDQVPLPFYVDGYQLHKSGKNPTGHILAGLASAMGGLMPPGRRFSRHHQRTVLELEWANGFHPFAPFSGASERHPSLSDLEVDVAKRNIVLSRLDHSIEVLKGTVGRLHFFILNNMPEAKFLQWTAQSATCNPVGTSSKSRKCRDSVSARHRKSESAVVEVGVASHIHL